MTVALLLVGDGRDAYRARTLASLNQAIDMAMFSTIIEVDDSDHRLGFAGAVQAGWDRVLETDAEWVFHLEADFTFRQHVPIEAMIGILRMNPHLAQIVLKRQPWNTSERVAGGIVEQHPDDYTERHYDWYCTWMMRDQRETWTEHRRFWSTNPCLYSTRFCRLGWPQVPQSEGMFTHRLLADPLLRFAFWGGKFDTPMVEHIGDERVGHGY